MFDLMKYDKYLEVRPGGVFVKDGTPDDVRAELAVINKNYKSIYHVNLIQL